MGFRLLWFLALAYAQSFEETNLLQLLTPSQELLSISSLASDAFAFGSSLTPCCSIGQAQRAIRKASNLAEAPTARMQLKTSFRARARARGRPKELRRLKSGLSTTTPRLSAWASLPQTTSGATHPCRRSPPSR